MSLKNLTSEELAERANKAVRTAIETAVNNAEKVAARAIAKITQKQMLKLCGMSYDSYQNEYTLSYRVEESPLRAEIERAATAYAKEFIAQLNPPPIEIKESDRKKFLRMYNAAYREAFDNELQEQVCAFAAELALKDVTALVKDAPRMLRECKPKKEVE